MVSIVSPSVRPTFKNVKRDGKIPSPTKSALIDSMVRKRAVTMRNKQPVTLPKLKWMEKDKNK